MCRIQVELEPQAEEFSPGYSMISTKCIYAARVQNKEEYRIARG
jgi:hypothetical protein